MIMYALPSDFPHDPPKGYSYEVHHFKRNVLSIWTRNHSEFIYNDGADSKCIWGFYHIQERVYYAPHSSKRVGKTVSLDETTAYSAMPLLKLALDSV